MGHVREQRSVKILEEALMEYLEVGTIPTSELLQESYDNRATALGDNARSEIRLCSLPERFKESSASDFNSLLDAFHNDLDVLLRAFLLVTQMNVDSVGIWNLRAKSLQRRVDALKSRVDSLLLMKSKMAGYVAFVEEDFTSLENISSETTAAIDTDVGEAVLNVDRTESVGSSQGTRIDIHGSKVAWTLLEKGNVQYTQPIGKGDPSSILMDSTDHWGTRVVATPPSRMRTPSTRNKPIVGEMKITLPSSTEVSKIVLMMAETNAGGPTVVSGQYSLDGYTWANLDSRTPALSGTRNFIWRIPRTEMNFIKFVFSKAAPDEEVPIGAKYDFGIQQLKLFSEIYDVTSDGVKVVSEVLTPKIANMDQSFGRCSLEVCEDLPPDTEIKYYLRGTTGIGTTSWVPVIPMNREGRDQSDVVVDFTSPIRYDSEELSTLLDSSLDNGALNILRVSGSDELTYRFDDENLTTTNFYIPSGLDVLSDLVLQRNTGYAAAKFPNVSADLQVRDTEVGWDKDGDGVYTCYFQIKNPDGRTFDFGRESAFIDGVRVDGPTYISPGWHSFRTNRANWASLTGDVPTTISELKTLDPLYPHNHKYIIEGYNFPASFAAEDGIYIGADEYCQSLATRIGRHQIRDYGYDPSVYALDNISHNRTIVLLKFDSSRPNHENERVRLIYNQRQESYSGVEFQAVLSTSDTERSPSLSYYRIMVK